jgi:two-component system chemotaxis response regulator CheB
MTRSEDLTILVVDDHQGFRESLVSFLRQMPSIEVVGEARDGQEAEDLAARLSPDLVTMEIKIPRLNGIEAAGRIASRRPSTRIILYSMHDPEVRQSEGLLANVEFIPKQKLFEEILPRLKRQESQ